ncbi:MAG: type II secretion system protein [Gallionella sp.]|nr:type II secretion system protein [Gallionella sp.]
MKTHPQNGFTLVEMAIVMFVMALMLGTGLTVLSAQQDQRRIEETTTNLDEAREALIGFAITNVRLPCPASAASGGLESFCTSATGICTETTTLQTHGRCAKPYDGFIPAVTLGIAPINTQGQLFDTWKNPVRYAITNANDASNIFYFSASPDGIRTRWNSGIMPAPDLRVCSTSTGLTYATPDSAECATGRTLTNNGVAVIYSLGKNFINGGRNGDEAHNPNPNQPVAIPSDRAFVFHEATPAEAVTMNGEFDDQLIWLSQYTLFNRMVQAGKLP